MGIEGIIIVIALILSIVLHEVAHGYAANWLGDPTARLQGRLTVNPIKHIDPIGSVVVPVLLFLTHSPFFFGWAKPVPYNPYNLKNQRWGEAIVAGAGPASNILLALIFASLIRFGDVLVLSSSFITFATTLAYINVFLAFLNLIPIPPLDGSKVLESILPLSLRIRFRELARHMDRFGFLGLFIFLIIFVQFFSGPLSNVVASVVSLLTGFST